MIVEAAVMSGIFGLRSAVHQVSVWLMRLLIVKMLPTAGRKTRMSYQNPSDGYAGTRNMLGIQTTVQCVQGVPDAAVGRNRRELLPRYR